MRILGIDYGTKRVGLAFSDENNRLAFPKDILPNDRNLFGALAEILKKEGVAEIVVGQSLAFSGEPNALQSKIDIFISELQQKFRLPTHQEKEFLTSVEARRYHSGGGRADARAAALILQRYLDKRSLSDPNGRQAVAR